MTGVTLHSHVHYNAGGAILVGGKGGDPVDERERGRADLGNLLLGIFVRLQRGCFSDLRVT